MFWKRLPLQLLIPRRPRAPHGRGIVSPEQLRFLLERERARADRRNDVFSLLLFSLRDVDRADPARFDPLIQILKRRLRLTDDVGWLDRDRIGVLLPDTPPAGAWKVADDVIAAYPTELSPPMCEVYAYPDDSLELEQLAPTTPEWEDEVDRPVHRMQALFVQPLPRWKRLLDLAGASLGLVMLSPVFLAAAAAVKLSSPGPIVFRQLRAGLGNRPFGMYKFRTMHVGADLRKAELAQQNEQDGPAFKIRNDPRVTRIGRWLRRTSIDELPQLWNVLKGEMTLVGPRPLPCDEADACKTWQKNRVNVTPGLTCIWQVEGRSSVSFDEWMRMDLRYIRARGFFQDLTLLARTASAVLLGRGAH
jgi:lipopolysaccharide/colanic/teichoic acid biosynthesis glycosyltransferase